MPSCGPISGLPISSTEAFSPSSTVTPVALVTFWDGIRPIPQTALTATTQPISPIPNAPVPTWFLGQLVPPPLRAAPRQPGWFTENVLPLAPTPPPEPFFAVSPVDLVPVGPRPRLQGWFTAGIPVALVRLDPIPGPQPAPIWPTFRPFTTVVAPTTRPTIPFDAAQQVATLPQPPRPLPLRWFLPTTTQPPSITAQAPPALSWKPVWRDTPVAVTRPTSVQTFAFYPVPIPQVQPTALAWQGRADVPPRARLSVAQQTQGTIAPFPITVPAYLFTMWKSYLPDSAARRTLLTAAIPAIFNPPWSETATVGFAAWRPLLPDWLARLFGPPPPAAALVPLPSDIARGVRCIMVSAPGVTASTLVTPAVGDPTLVDARLTVSTLVDPEIC